MEEIEGIRLKLKSVANEGFAKQSKKYLKSPYEFYGIRVPELRKIAKEYKNLGIYNAYNLFEELWNSGNHEEMSLGLFILENYKKQFNHETWKFLRQRLSKAKTWDHVDEISSHIFGEILLKDLSLMTEIKEMSLSRNPWERRTSMVSTIQLIRKGKIELTFRLAEKLVYDEDVYVHKSAGWMLRECGKKQRIATKEFMLMHLDMKSTAFSYATEKMKEMREIKKRKKEEGKEK
ncbi:MAG: DNA alkylation repair protein [Nanoarchaeota archaeon]|nr:DNA alkylation repair protein [Nanoarchaeota archaeon]